MPKGGKESSGTITTGLVVLVEEVEEVEVVPAGPAVVGGGVPCRQDLSLWERRSATSRN